MDADGLVSVTSADGTRIGAFRSGYGPSLVVVHGAAADSGAFGLVAPLLADCFTVYRMDRRGRGVSGDGPEYSFAREVEDVVTVCQCVPGPVYLYGHSFGGGLAWEAARRLPDLAGLILYEGGPKPPVRFASDELIMELQALVDAGRSEDALARFMLTAAGVNEVELATLQQQEAWAGRVAAAHTIPRELRASNDYAADPASFDEVAAPALTLIGSDSLPERRHLFEGIAAKIRNARVVELAGQRHAANTTAPDVLAEAIRGILDRHPPREETGLEFVTVGGLRVGYRRVGRGQPIVLLHGGFQDSRSWAPQLAGLSDEFTIYALDAPGFGASDDPPETWTTGDYGDHLASVLAALGLDRPLIVGLSFGSVHALALYHQRPDSVGALLLASAYAGWAGSLTPEEVERRLEASLRDVEGPPERIIEQWLPTWFTPQAPQEVVTAAAEVMRGFHPSGTRTALRALGAVDLHHVLATITAPTLFVYGDADIRSPLDPVGRQMRASVPGSQLVVVPGAPHVLNLEQPEEFNSVVRDFARSLIEPRA